MPSERLIPARGGFARAFPRIREPRGTRVKSRASLATKLVSGARYAPHTGMPQKEL